MKLSYYTVFNLDPNDPDDIELFEYVLKLDLPKTQEEFEKIVNEFGKRYILYTYYATEEEATKAVADYKAKGIFALMRPKESVVITAKQFDELIYTALSDDSHF